MGSHVALNTPLPPAEEDVSPTDERKEDDEEEIEPRVKFDLEANEEKVYLVEFDEDSIIESKSLWPEWLRHDKLLPYQRLMTDQRAFENSMGSVRFAIVAMAINIKLLQPNYAIMVSPDASDESFPNTDPFDFNSATYFIPMMSMLGIAIAGVFVGQISDKYGRKPVMLVTTGLSVLASLSRYFARKSFWPFCITNLITGLFSGNLPVAMAYVGDVFATKREKDTELGVLVGSYVFGSSFGGVIAILMESTGLFKPLFVSTAMVAISFYGISQYMLEPGAIKLMGLQPKAKDSDEDEEADAPEEIDQKAMWNIIVGSLADNIGSCGLMPLCLSPLALNQFTIDFLEQGLDPIMEIIGYQWLSVMTALMVIPSTVICPVLFEKIGVAAACVFGNACTAVVTLILLLLGNGDATNTKFAFFVFFLYAGFPFTVISQLTTGPMLEKIAPVDKRGYVQGMNSTVMNFGLAVSPWILGLLADAASTNASILTGMAVSILAALINVPLMFRKGFQPKPKAKEEDDETQPLVGEEQEVIDKALRGDWVHPEALWNVNRGRILKKQPPLLIRPKKYEDERDSLPELAKHAQEDFTYRKARVENYLTLLAGEGKSEKAAQICKLVNAQFSAKASGKERVNAEIGQWFADYLQDNGYRPHAAPTLMKEMIMVAFPPISTDEDVTPETVEQVLLNAQRVYNKYLDRPVEHSSSLTRIYKANGNFNIYG